MPGPPGAPTLGLALPGRLPALAPASSATGSGEAGIAEKPAGVSPVSRYFSASARPSLNTCERDSNHRQNNTSLKDQYGIFAVLICRGLAATMCTAWTDAVLPIMVDDAAQCLFLKFCMPTLTLPFECRFSVADVEGHKVALPFSDQGTCMYATHVHYSLINSCAACLCASTPRLAIPELRMSPAHGQALRFHLELALGGQVLLTAQVKGHEIALALNPGEVVGAKEAHWHSTPPGYLHVRGDPGVIDHQDLQESAQAHPQG